MPPLGAHHRLIGVGALLVACGAPAEPAVGTPTPVPRPAPAARPESVDPIRALPVEPRRPGFLKGQTHVHTSRSYDAKTPPDVVLSFYRARSYDFVAVTDHNRVTSVAAPDGLLLVPGVELTQNSARCEPPPAPGFRCLFHTSALFVDPARDAARGERMQLAYRPGRRAAYESQLEIARELGGIPVVNHPLFHFAADAKLLQSLKARGLVLIELFNASLDRQHPGGRAAAERRAEQLWDELLTSGSLLFALASDDAHHFADAAQRRRSGKFAYDGDRGWVMVRAERNLPSIERALISGDFYSSTGIELAELERGPNEIRVRIAADSSAGYQIRFIGDRGRELAVVSGLEARYELSGSESYVRAVVEGPEQTKAWIQPLMRSGSMP
jgi:hypothetical protein